MQLRSFLRPYPDSGEVVPVERLGGGQVGRVAGLPLLLPELPDVHLAQLVVQVDVPPEAVAVVRRRLLEGHLEFWADTEPLLEHFSFSVTRARSNDE